MAGTSPPVLLLRRESSLFGRWLGGSSEQEDGAQAAQPVQQESSFDFGRLTSNASSVFGLTRLWSSAGGGQVGYVGRSSSDSSRSGRVSSAPGSSRGGGRIGYVGRASSGSSQGGRASSTSSWLNLGDGSWSPTSSGIFGRRLSSAVAAPPLPDEEGRVRYAGPTSGSSPGRASSGSPSRRASAGIPAPSVQEQSPTQGPPGTGLGLFRRLSSAFAAPAVEVPDGAAGQPPDVASPTGGLGFFKSVSFSWPSMAAGERGLGSGGAAKMDEDPARPVAGGAAGDGEALGLDCQDVCSLEDYCLRHMGIQAADLKPTAVLRIKDMARLFRSLQSSGIVRLIAAGQGRPDCIFGFERILVEEIANFSEAFAHMVQEDRSHCWHANGRKTITHPTTPCYELV